MNSVSVRLLLPAVVAAVSLVSGCSTYGVRNPSGSGVKVLQPEEAGTVAGTGPVTSTSTGGMSIGYGTTEVQRTLIAREILDGRYSA